MIATIIISNLVVIGIIKLQVATMLQNNKSEYYCLS